MYTHTRTHTHTHTHTHFNLVSHSTSTLLQDTYTQAMSDTYIYTRSGCHTSFPEAPRTRYGHFTPLLIPTLLRNVEAAYVLSAQLATWTHFFGSDFCSYILSLKCLLGYIRHVWLHKNSHTRSCSVPVRCSDERLSFGHGGCELCCHAKVS